MIPGLHNERIPNVKKAWLFLCAATLVFGVGTPLANAQTFKDQIDIDFTFKSLDQVISDLLPAWTAENVWDDVLYQTGPGFSGADNDANGIYDDDHFDLLAAVYDGEPQVVANLDPATVTLIRNTFNANLAKTQTIEVTLNNVHAEAFGGLVKLDKNITTGSTLDVFGQSVDIPSLWQGDDALLDQVPVIKSALLNLVGCYMTTGDDTSIAHLQSLLAVIINTVIEDLVPQLLGDVGGDIYIDTFTIDPSSGDMYVKVCGIDVVDCVEVWVYGNEIDATIARFSGAFNCADFAAAGGGCLPQLLGANGNLNGDGNTNLASYNASATRQEFMENEGINYPPLQIVDQPDSVTTESGVAVSFSIGYVEGLPGGPVNYKWDLTDMEDFESEGVVSTNAVYSIAYPLPTGDDPLAYTATICDPLWTRRSAPAVLTVNYIPLQALSQPSGGDVFVSDPFSTSFTVKGGVSIPTFQWYKDTVLLDGYTSNTLNFASLELSDSGTYYCVASGQNSGPVSASVQSNSIVINVVDRIRFQQHPQNGEIYIEQPYTFSVEVIGNVVGTLNYQWQKYAGDKGDWQDIPEATGPEYAIESATLADNGNYRCVIYDDVFTIPSNVASLLVVEHMAFTAIPADSTGWLDGTFTFTVEVSGGLGTLHFVWKKDDNPIGGDAPTLTLYPVQESDAGSYMVEVSDRYEMIASDPPAILIVAPPFNFLQQPTGADLYSGASHTFTIAVEGGTPPFIYTWKKDGVALGVPSDPQLSVGPLVPSDSGVYTCSVMDQNGSNSSDPAVLNVADHMSIAGQPQSGTVYIGDPFTFIVNLDGGLAPIEYSWFKRQGEIDINLNAHEASYTIPSASEITAGTYFCNITDKFESIQSNTATMTAVNPLSFAQHPQDAYRFTGGSVSFAVTTSGGLGTIQYQWLHDGNPVGTNSTVLTIDDLTCNDIGEYLCQATDSVKTSTSETANLVIFIAPDSDGMLVSISMSGQEVVPPTASVATGFGFGSLRPSSLTDEYTFTMSVTHMVSSPTGASINRGIFGENGPQVFNLGNGVSAIGFSRTLSNGQAAELAAGFYYIQVTSAAYPAGEIRGQLNTPDPGICEVSEGEGAEGEGEGEGEGAEGEGAEGEGEGAEGEGESAEGEGEGEGEGAEGEGEGEGEGEEDLTPPEITLVGLATMNQECSVAFTDPGATAEDNIDGDISGNILVTGVVDTSTPGEYTLTYTVSDAAGNAADPVVRTVIVEDTTVPVVTLVGDAEITMQCNDSYVELGATAVDSCDTNLPDVNIDASGVITAMAGVYEVIYSVTDASGNQSAPVTRTVIVAGSCIPEFQNADQNQDNKIELSELLRVIQFYNSYGLHCQEGTEDGYAPGPGSDYSCAPHTSDYNPQNWQIDLTELLRIIQFYNVDGYHVCREEGTEDGYCLGLP